MQTPILHRRRGFTLVEMIVVVGIIILLMGILLPVADRVWKKAHIVNSQNVISRLAGGIERYHSDFSAYPGFLKNEDITKKNLKHPDGPTLAGKTSGTLQVLTSTEAMILSLVGGVTITSGSTFRVTAFTYDPKDLGRGMMSLNPRSPKRYPAYVDIKPDEYTEYTAEDKTRKDSEVPEVEDGFNDGLPVLFLRAKPGMAGILDSNDSSAQYNWVHIKDYYKNGDSSRSTPFNNNGTTAREYFTDPKTGDVKATQSAKNPIQARQRDSYILISAGPDRKYGTDDDICNFGPVK